MLAAATSAALMPLAAAGAAAAATVPTYTWTGTAALGSSHDLNWSDGANWKGGIAPTAPGPVNLVFPTLKCSNSKVDCGSSDNDLTGLTVAKLTVDSGQTVYRQGSYYLYGNGVTVEQLVADGYPYGYSSPQLQIPVTIPGSEKWTIDGSFLTFDSITGPGTLTISLGDLAQPSIDGAVSVGALDVVGQNTQATGDSAYSNGYFDVQTGASISSPLKVRNVEFDDYPSASLQSLATAGAALYTGGSTGSTLPVQGSGKLDPLTVIGVQNLAPTNTYEMTATGSLALNTAQLNLSADCGQALGTAYTLVSATGGITGILREDYQFGNVKIENGTIIHAQAAYDGTCTGTNSPPYLQFAYNDAAGTVTATVVAKP